jgi:hypothetical protein
VRNLLSNPKDLIIDSQPSMNIFDFISFIIQSKKKNKRALEKIRHLQIYNKEFEHAITTKKVVSLTERILSSAKTTDSISQNINTAATRHGECFSIFFLRSITAKYTIQINGDNMILIIKKK